jgi:hypothetical protein
MKMKEKNNGEDKYYNSKIKKISTILEITIYYF